MLKQEWKSLFHNKILLLVVIVIALIPAIYAGLFLASMWDPYGNVDKLPVAIVNEDEPAEYGDTTLTVGDQLVDNLKENDSLAFNFVDADVAKEGLKNGTYYMVITIPKNFSANAATVMDDQPEKMILNYETNPGTNYIASKLSETALGKIKTSIREEVTKTYTEAIFDQIGTAGDGMQEAADGAKKIKDGMDDASDGNKKITDNLKVLADSTLTFKEGSEELTEGLKSYTDGVAQVNDGAKQLDDGVSTLTASLPTLTNGVDRLNSGVKEYTDGVATLNSNSEALNSGSKQLAEGSEQLKEGAATLNSGTQTYVAGVNQLSGGLLGVNGANGYITGVNSLTTGLLGSDQSAGYIDGVEQLATGAKQLSGLTGIGQVYAGIVNLNNAVSGVNTEGTLQNGTAALKAGIKQIQEQVSALQNTTSAEGLKKLSAGLSSAKTGMENASAASTKAAEISGQVESSIEALPGQLSTALGSYMDVVNAAVADGNSKIAKANEQITAANDKLKNVQSVADQLTALSANAAEGENVQVSAEILKSLANTLSSAQGGASTVDSVSADTYTAKAAAVTKGINDQLSASQTSLNTAKAGLEKIASGLNDGAKQLADGASAIPSDIPSEPVQALSDGLAQVYAGATKVDTGVGQVAAGLTQLQTSTASFPAAAKGVAALNAGFEKLTANDATLKAGATQLQQAGTTVAAGATQLLANGSALTAGTAQAAAGTETLAAGAQTLTTGLATYTAGVSALNSNSAALTNGTQQLADGAKTLGSGATTLANGTSTLYNGTKTLVANNSKLNSGATQLTDGAGQIQDGSSQLYDGSKELGDGLKKLDDGSDTLQSSLADGAETVKENKAEDVNYEMIAAPVDDDEAKMTEVPNNGHAMAPYMMSVGLWVGALAFCLMYPLTKYNGKLKSGFAWWGSKASVLYPLALLQGILVIFLLHVFDGFTPAQMGKAVAFACLTSVAFTSIMYFFNISLGKVGSFLMLVFMVIQLAGSAGTYPIQLSPAFVSKIHAWVPFTYSVDAFRSVICAGESIRTPVIVMCVITIVFTILTIIEFQFRTRRIKAGKPIFHDFLEEKGLA